MSEVLCSYIFRKISRYVEKFSPKFCDFQLKMTDFSGTDILKFRNLLQETFTFRVTEAFVVNLPNNYKNLYLEFYNKFIFMIKKQKFHTISCYSRNLKNFEKFIIFLTS